MAKILPPGIEPDGATPSLHLSPSRGERVFGAAAARLCGAASLLLGWRPDEFWGATPAELALALSPPGTSDPAPADRAILEALRQRFPDQ